MNRLRAGAALVGKSWRVVREQPWVISAVAGSLVLSCVTSLGLFVVIFERMPNSRDGVFPHYLLVFPFLWLVSFINNWCACLVIVVADARLHDTTITFADALRVVAARWWRILAWTLVAGVVGLVLYVIAERLKLAGRIVERVVGLAWSFATVFVLPVLVFEDISVSRSIGRSAGLFRKIWVVQVAAGITIELVGIIAALPAVVLVVAVGVFSVPLAIVLGVVAFAAFTGAFGALQTVVDVAAYRLASDGLQSSVFSEDELRGQYRNAEE